MPDLPNDPIPGIVSPNLTTTDATSQETAFGSAPVIEVSYADDFAVALVGVPAS